MRRGRYRALIVALLLMVVTAFDIWTASFAEGMHIPSHQCWLATSWLLPRAAPR